MRNKLSNSPIGWSVITYDGLKISGPHSNKRAAVESRDEAQSSGKIALLYEHRLDSRGVERFHPVSKDR